MSESDQGALVVISGPSGVGKSTICRRLVDRLDAMVSVSATTRPRAANEQDGVEYCFLSRQEFERKLAAGEFLEHAEYLGNLYGTPVGPVREALEAGRIVVLEIEVQGGLQVAQRFPDAVMIYILPSDPQVLIDRIQGRGRDPDDVMAERLANADGEIKFARDSGRYTYFVVNDALDETVARIVEIIEQQRRRLAARPNTDSETPDHD